MEVDKLLVVAHPDDELLWGGANLFAEPGWFVVCATNANNSVRSLEFYKSMSFANVTKFLMYDVKDEYTDYESKADKLFDNSLFEKGLQELSKHSWKLVLTHNEEGEYGHEHHRKVHRMVSKYFPSAKFFNAGKHLSPQEFEMKRESLLFYSKTQDICKKIFNKQGNKLRPSERSNFFNETIYVSKTREIPKLIHQIWFGKPLDTSSVRANLILNVEKVAKRNGYDYKLWTNENFKKEMFPLTWEYMETALQFGEELGQSRYAQVADLARYELLHRFGGIYLDSLFEIGDDFCKYISKHANYEIIVANEDPCELDCKGVNNEKYLSNGFFACVSGCLPLKRLLHPATLKYIDFESVYINQETGPYLFRKGIKSRDNVHVIPTSKIYPFMINDSNYREGEPNLCITDDKKILHNCLITKYKKSLAVYQSGFGGSWSW